MWCSIGSLWASIIILLLHFSSFVKFDSFFLLLQIPKKGKIYSVNEGNAKHWDQPTTKYVENAKFPEDGSSPKSLRYIGRYSKTLWKYIISWPAIAMEMQTRIYQWIEKLTKFFWLYWVVRCNDKLPHSCFDSLIVGSFSQYGSRRSQNSTVWWYLHVPWWQEESQGQAQVLNSSSFIANCLLFSQIKISLPCCLRFSFFRDSLVLSSTWALANSNRIPKL